MGFSYGYYWFFGINSAKITILMNKKKQNHESKLVKLKKEFKKNKYNKHQNVVYLRVLRKEKGFVYIKIQ